MRSLKRKCEQSGIPLTFSSPYHHQANKFGRKERWYLQIALEESNQEKAMSSYSSVDVQDNSSG